MRRFAVAVALLLSGCGPDCAPGPNIQVTVSATPGVDPTRISVLRVVLSVDGMLPKTLDVPIKSPLTSMPKTLLLQPDPAPSPKYNVALSVQSLDANGNVFALGTAEGDVVSNGCNRLDASLFPLGGGGGDGGGGGGGDGNFTPPDLFSADMSNCSVTPANMSTVPDEDSDGRADSCDLCPDDYDPMPVDSDLDGLPDACDPDPATPSNTLVFFDPFNANSGLWSGNFNLKPFPQGYWDIDSQGCNAVYSGNSTVMLQANVRVQAHIFSPGVYPNCGPGGATNADFGIFLGSNSNPGLSTGDGILCVTAAVPGQPDQLILYTVSGGSLTQPSAMQIGGGGWSTGVMYRMRLTQRGAMYTCELASNSMAPTVLATVSKAVLNAPTGPQFMALRGNGLDAHFHAVVAESVLP
jgi:hypothetical protein